MHLPGRFLHVLTFDSQRKVDSGVICAATFSHNHNCRWGQVFPCRETCDSSAKEIPDTENESGPEILSAHGHVLCLAFNT